jgi:periplasmic protein TonB
VNKALQKFGGAAESIPGGLIMFEDSTFESTGRIKTRSRRWMIAALALDGSILVAMILIPLIHPVGLPRVGPLILMEAPKPPADPVKPVKPEHVTVVRTQIPDGRIFAPPAIPPMMPAPGGPEALQPINVAELGGPTSAVGSGSNPFVGRSAAPVVKPAPTGPMPVSSGLMTGRLIYKVAPTYPAIGVAARVEGTIVLQAIISKRGTIENLRVVSGPAMLQQAALNAVKQWRYQPYELDGQPVEVETTVNVVFTLAR